MVQVKVGNNRRLAWYLIPRCWRLLLMLGSEHTPREYTPWCFFFGNLIFFFFLEVPRFRSVSKGRKKKMFRCVNLGGIVVVMNSENSSAQLAGPWAVFVELRLSMVPLANWQEMVLSR